MSQHISPGNVRKLENVIGNACMMADGNVIDLADLPPPMKAVAELQVDEEADLISFEGRDSAQP